CRLWNTSDGKEAGKWALEQPPTCAVPDASGRHLFVGGARGGIVLFEAATAKPVQRWQTAGNKEVSCLAVSRDGQWLAAGEQQALDLFARAAAGSRAVVRGHSGDVQGTAFAAPNRLISCSEDQSVRLWSLPEPAGAK